MERQDLKNVLWDVNDENIASLPDDFVIQRILSYGGISLVAKAMHQYGSDKVGHVFESMKSTSIPARKYSYLKNFLLI